MGNEVVPLNLLQLFSARELEHLVCGSVTVDLELLKRHTTYFGGYSSINDAPIQLMWRALESFSHAERSLFLRFVWGRSRLPRPGGEWPQKFNVQVSPGSSQDLPGAATCCDRLRYAIKYCKAIDTDFGTTDRAGWLEV